MDGTVTGQTAGVCRAGLLRDVSAAALLRRDSEREVEIGKTFVLKNNVLSVIKQVIFHLISSGDYFK